MELGAGIHQFDFSYFLPANLPSTFKSENGETRFRIFIDIERSGKLNKTFGFDVNVKQEVDLGLDETLRHGATSEMQKSFMMASDQEKLHIVAMIPVSGFISGQRIPVMIKMMNNSSITVDATDVSLVQIGHYTAQEPVSRIYKNDEKTVAKTYYEGVEAKDSVRIEGLLMVPDVIPSSIGAIDIVRVSYEIRVRAKVGALHRDAVITLPVTIGTIPFGTSTMTDQF